MPLIADARTLDPEPPSDEDGLETQTPETTDDDDGLFTEPPASDADDPEDDDW